MLSFSALTRLGTRRPGRPGALSVTATAALLLAAGAGTVQAAPASQSALAGSCEFSNTLCLFEGAGYAGARFTVQALPPATSACVSLAEHGWAGRAFSAVNTNSRTATLYAGENCTGASLNVEGSLSPLTVSAVSVRVY
ncbi:peptidase inhibitor family I36 protein [Streptomyces sp. NBC_01317]|uniref:peptidase inhibitor family I36 protein n=1 Tax=Streptomyces sp. NBC_01317 TaxID=2903822 RepID=UPI002E14D473|nr:peptidase inhibitor family I36 protein [Streptomyces sp. NBC_01317]